jgi:hypothetical protein
LHAGAFVTADEIGKLIAIIGAPTVAVLVILWVLLFPEKVQTVSGWLWTLLSGIVKHADRRAIALRVQGHVNATTKRLVKHMPEGIVEGKLKLRWSTSEEARAILRDGEVVVFMKRSRHHEENVAQALMVYLPKAVLSHARRYIAPTTMAAVDLTLAKVILGHAAAEHGVLDVFYEQHLDPACEADEALKQQIVEMDEIDLHGWLLRIVLPEFGQLGRQLHPAMPDARCRADADAFTRWLASLAKREPGDTTLKLSYEGSHLRVAVVFVAVAQRLAREGIDPYRKVAKRLVYSGKFERVYLMARDHNISAVKQIVESLAKDGRVDAATCFEYRLRPDFAKRKLNRHTAVVAAITPHGTISVDQMLDEDLSDLDLETFVPDDAQAPSPRFYEPAREGSETDVTGPVLAPNRPRV